ncbi:MAG: hypothetical protein ACI8XO_002262 [Verrucomicrobiales bacterium]|jgi:hypothetical protein
MHFPASNIAIANSRCPSCGQTISEQQRACVSCGYGFEFAQRMLPYTAPELRKFIDREGHLTRDDIRRGQRALEKLRVHFPQVTLCTCVVSVPEGISLSEFGFWLFNHSVPNGPRLIERRLHSILLTIDPKRQEAALTTGYGLDPFISDASLTECLTKIQKPLLALQYGRALSKLCKRLRPILNAGFEQASRSYMKQIDARKREQHEQRHQPISTTTEQPTSPAPVHRIVEYEDSHV